MFAYLSDRLGCEKKAIVTMCGNAIYTICMDHIEAVFRNLCWKSPIVVQDIEKVSEMNLKVTS